MCLNNPSLKKRSTRRKLAEQSNYACKMLRNNNAKTLSGWKNRPRIASRKMDIMLDCTGKLNFIN